MILRLQKCFGYLLCMLVLSTAGGVLAQDETAAEEEDSELTTVLDDSPIMSPRAAGMGGALSALADGNDAAYYNPAGIGGIHYGKKKPKKARQFYFFHGGLSQNKNSQELGKEFRKEGAAKDATIGSAVLDAHAGERQYARAALFPNFGYSRFIIGPIADIQMAAIPQGEDTDLVDLHYQERSGVAFGASFTDPKERLYLGFFSSYLNIKDVNGEFLYTDVAEKERRKAAIKDFTNKYSGVANNVGLLWRIAKPATPSLAIVARNVGDTHYNKTKGDGENLVVKQDLTVGFAVSPPLGKIGFYNFTVEGAKLSDKNTAVKRKWKTAMEFTFGGRGTHAILGIRGGYNHAGASFGSHLNIGLLGFQYANFAEDIGIENNRVIERRQNFLFSIDLAN